METFAWEPLGPCRKLHIWQPWEPLLGNLCRKLHLATLLGNLGNLHLGTLGNLSSGTFAGFGAAPASSETFTMAEDPKASAVGEQQDSVHMYIYIYLVKT